MTDPKIFEEIRSMFSGVCPNIFLRMHEAGVLDNHWPKFRAVVDPGPLPRAVAEALLTIFSARCGNAYCFVMHSLWLLGQGASVIAIEDLGRLFDMPAIVPEHERWSRVLKLAWLVGAGGPHRAAADFMLRQLCREHEYAHVMRACEAGVELARFISVHDVTLEHEPKLAHVPDEVRGLVPTFVQFHSRMNATDLEQRPVAAMCSMCRAVRSTDGEWYPFEVARELLAADVLFSHGLCEGCLDPGAEESGAARRAK